MGKKGSKKSFEDNLRWRYEFIRENGKYVEARKKLLRKLKSLDDVKRKYVAFRFFIYWGINYLVDPTKSYDENKKSLKDEMFFLPPTFLELETPILDSKLRGTFYLNLQCPKRAIVRSFEEQLEKYIEVYDNKIKDKAIKDTRARAENYERYLEIYKVRKKGLSWEEIAEEYYDISISGMSYSKRAVKRIYERCKEIIDGEYRQIR